MRTESRALDVALRRLEVLCAKAGRLPRDCAKAERMAMVAEIDASIRALRAVQGDLRQRIARTRRCRPAVVAYGRAANILQSPRR